MNVKFLSMTGAVLILASCVSAPMVKTPAVSEKEIVPGKGMGAVVIGAQAADLKALMGEPLSEVSYKEELAAFKDFGYNPEQELQFVIGFDYVWVYEPSSNATDIPAWKLYFKNDRLIYINFSSFIYSSKGLRSIGVPPSGFFYATKDEMIQALGQDYTANVDESGNEQYFYLSKGITPIIVDGAVRVFHVYAPRTP